VGIVDIEQPDEETATIVLTDGREIDIKLPRGKDGAGGGAATIQHVSVAGGGYGQQVFIGTPPSRVNYPALAFVPTVIDGQTVYQMKVNNGAP
jgi:hypothetical protein